MKVKDDSVNLVDLHPKLQAALPIIDEWWLRNAGYPAVVTSGCDGAHTAKYSNHYKGCAVDIRTWTTATSGRQIAATKRQRMARELADALGPHFRVLNERHHFHIDFHPTVPVTWQNL